MGWRPGYVYHFALEAGFPGDSTFTSADRLVGKNPQG
jgi:hypothetical protein